MFEGGEAVAEFGAVGGKRGRVNAHAAFFDAVELFGQRQFEVAVEGFKARRGGEFGRGRPASGRGGGAGMGAASTARGGRAGRARGFSDLAKFRRGRRSATWPRGHM